MTIGDRVIGLGGNTVRSLLGDVTPAGSAGGTTQANSPVPTTAITYTTTCASGAGWTLPANLNFGDEITIVNAQATNPMLVWPPVGGAFNGLSANTSISVPASKSVIIKCISPLLFGSNISA